MDVLEKRVIIRDKYLYDKKNGVFVNNYDFLRCDTYTHLSDSDKQDLDTLATWHDPYTVAVCQPIDYITEFRDYDHVMYEYQRLVYFFRLMNEPKKYASNNQMYRFEQHHLLPKSLGGKHDKSNMIYLPVSYHIYIHYLLTLMYDHNDNQIGDHFEKVTRSGLNAFKAKGKMNECGFIEYQVLDYASRKWSLPKLIAHVKGLGAKTPKEWYKKCPKSYSMANRFGLEKVKRACGITSSIINWSNDPEEALDQLISHVKPLGFKTPKEWQNGCSKSYHAAHKSGLLVQVYKACRIEYQKRKSGTITKELIIRYSLTCKTKQEFRNKDISMITAAMRFGILKDYHLHMYPTMRVTGHQIFDLLLTNPDATEYDRYESPNSSQKQYFKRIKKKFQNWIVEQIKLGFYAYDPVKHCYHPTDKLNLGGEWE